MISVVPKVNVFINEIDTKNNKLLNRQEVHNLAVLSGRNLIRDLLAGDDINGLSHFALGTDNTEVSTHDQGLTNEVFRAQITKFEKYPAKLNVVYYLSSLNCNGKTLREAGLFNAASDGSMYARVIFNKPITKNENKAVTFTWELNWEVI